MAWNLSTGAKKELASNKSTCETFYIANTITFTDSQITDSANGLGSFSAGDHVNIIGGANHNKVAKVLSAAAGQLDFAAGTFTAEAAGTLVCLGIMSGGSFLKLFEAGTIHIFTGARPATADDVENGTKLVELTLNGDTFTAGNAENGCNLGILEADGTLKRAIDPAEAGTVVEKWSGDGIADGTAGWARWYDNSLTTGASTTAVRMDGIVTTATGGDLVMPTTSISTGAPVSVTDVKVKFKGV